MACLSRVYSGLRAGFSGSELENFGTVFLFWSTDKHRVAVSGAVDLTAPAVARDPFQHLQGCKVPRIPCTFGFCKMVELRKREKLEDQEGRQLESSEATLMAPSVVDYGNAAAYATELRKWLFTTHCWAYCHQMATMHSLVYLASCNRPDNMVSHAPFGVTLPTQNASSSIANLQNPNQFIQRRTIPSFTRRILAEIIDSIFAFVAKLLIVYFLVEIGVV
ncbi:RDD family protein [Wuchereria bancrofti]|uniref:RDD family protein n=1 Tax=Wuchereria bancrofti TaxID=6293 RepID=J9EX27_WUCBA|nr:RDD family protein [Wuchereria bancrofti]